MNIYSVFNAPDMFGLSLNPIGFRKQKYIKKEMCDIYNIKHLRNNRYGWIYHSCTMHIARLVAVVNEGCAVYVEG